MSVPEFHLELSDLAQLDFRDILSFTLQMWGEEQLIEYKGKIDGALQTIAGNPGIGRPHDDTTLHVLPIGRHQIFYLVDGATVYVVRILHERMKASRHLRAV